MRYVTHGRLEMAGTKKKENGNIRNEVGKGSENSDEE